MKKINLLILITIWSCKEEPKIDSCACKFNMDLIFNKDNKEFENLLKFYDQSTMQECLDHYKKINPTDKILSYESVYKIYDNACPSYDISIEK